MSEGVLHRDVKDENVLIDLKTNQIKLIDFGSGTFLQDDVYTEYEGKIIYYNISQQFIMWCMVLKFHNSFNDSANEVSSPSASLPVCIITHGSTCTCASTLAEKVCRGKKGDPNPDKHPSLDEQHHTRCVCVRRLPCFPTRY